ncbi:MAG: hypothetical protein M1156_00180 [Candidatus Marsarchaeota archaeon]|jgi:hypothetical protein|nr:hypothetical protein [Candidatus Marsarchaeota archaeon]
MADLMSIALNSATLLQSVPGYAAANSTTYLNAATIYTENTIAVMLTLLTILAISIQVARGYFLRVLKKFTLRVAADVWWLIYVILRDASIFLVVFLGFMLFYPGIYQDFPIAVPFMPLAVDFFAIALVIMLIKDTDEDIKYNNVLTILIAVGTFLYIFGTIFVTESATQLANLPPTVSNSASNIWGFVNTYFNSMNNPALSIYSFYICFGILVIAGIVALRYGLEFGIPRSSVITNPNPIIKQTGQPQNPPKEQAQEQRPSVPR